MHGKTNNVVLHFWIEFCAIHNRNQATRVRPASRRANIEFVGETWKDGDIESMHDRRVREREKKRANRILRMGKHGIAIMQREREPLDVKWDDNSRHGIWLFFTRNTSGPAKRWCWYLVDDDTRTEPTQCSLADRPTLNSHNVGMPVASSKCKFHLSFVSVASDRKSQKQWPRPTKQNQQN